MRFGRELFEMFVALILLAPAFYIVRRPARFIKGWVVQVIASCLLAILGLGFTLMRLTARCSIGAPPCTEGLTEVPRTPGIIDSCEICASSSPAPISEFLNGWALEAQGVTAAICLLVSLLTVLRFAIWTRKNVISKQ